MGIPPKKATLEEYLLMESMTDEKLEYINGTIRSMAGTSIEHNIICNKLIQLLNQCLLDKGCVLMNSDMKLFTPECDKAFLYPDIHIYCGEIQKEKMKQGAYALKEPSIIIEVLSGGTSDYDKNQKFECYRRMKSLKQYIMIESDLNNDEVDTNTEDDELIEEKHQRIKEKKEPKVFVRTLEHEKRFIENVFDIEDSLEILGCKISVKEIYEYFL